MEALKEVDFVLVNVKGTDISGHDGNGVVIRYFSGDPFTPQNESSSVFSTLLSTGRAVVSPVVAVYHALADLDTGHQQKSTTWRYQTEDTST